MKCTSATFESMESAGAKKRALALRKFPPVQIYLCGFCDKFHFRGAPDMKMWKTMARTLRLCAMGFNYDTIAEMTGYTERTVFTSLSELRQYFGALNNPHLVSIAISLGYLDPNEFVPPVTDKEHDA